MFFSINKLVLLQNHRLHSFIEVSIDIFLIKKSFSNNIDCSFFRQLRLDRPNYACGFPMRIVLSEVPLHLSTKEPTAFLLWRSQRTFFLSGNLLGKRIAVYVASIGTLRGRALQKMRLVVASYSPTMPPEDPYGWQGLPQPTKHWPRIGWNIALSAEVPRRLRCTFAEKKKTSSVTHENVRLPPNCSKGWRCLHLLFENLTFW